MQTFLETVAADLYRKRGGDFAGVTVVFPNKRAALFFSKALEDICERPIWSPKYTTISELFRSRSPLELADRITLVSELYKVCRDVTGNADETLDQFYSWGEIMLGDFDDVDKHMADARQVFTLLGDLHELDTADYLNEEQLAAVRRFFANFSPDHSSRLKERFLRLWSKFREIYARYRQRLADAGAAYEGMLYREVAGDLKRRMLRGDGEEASNETVVFAGFNLLSPAEEQLFEYYAKFRNAKFYWDYDRYYIMNEAGKYIAQYLKPFPNELADDCGAYDNFRRPKDIAFIAAPTEDIQARYIAQWLTPERIAAGRRTAIVMADEALLGTVLHCLPDEVKHVNITTGYPLRQSPATSFVMIALSLMQRDGRYTLRTVNAILRHPYAKHLSPKAEELCRSLNERQNFYPTAGELSADDNLRRLFAPMDDPASVIEMIERLLWLVKTAAVNAAENGGERKDDFTNEALYRMYTLLNRLHRLAADGGQGIDAALFQRLLQQIINATAIPFHGEPIEGIQVMGVLETRNLDFDHILLLSCNDGNLPAKTADSSFIPHTIRKAHGLTTIDSKSAIYAFYFHRLLQRAGHVSVTYNSAADGMRTGDMSRFLLQMLAEYPFPIKRLTLEAGQSVRQAARREIAKTPEMIERLLDKGKLSPSALGKYLRCPLQFYYQQVAGIRDNTDEDTETMDPRALGNIFHKAAESLYKERLGRALNREFYDRLLDKADKTAEKLVDDAFRTEYFKITDKERDMPKLGGLQLINREMALTFLRNTLARDRNTAPLTVREVESRHYMQFGVTLADGAERRIEIGGTVDRVDELTADDGRRVRRVVDYKTGKKPEKLGLDSVEDIFDPANVEKHSDYFLQTFLYALVLSEQDKGETPVTAALLFVQSAAKEDYDPTLLIGGKPVTDIGEYADEYRERLHALVNEIFNAGAAFRPTAVTKRCERCAYAKICR